MGAAATLLRIAAMNPCWCFVSLATFVSGVLQPHARAEARLQDGPLPARVQTACQVSL